VCDPEVQYIKRQQAGGVRGEAKAREITGAIGFLIFVPLADAKAADSLGQLTVPTAKTDLL